MSAYAWRCKACDNANQPGTEVCSTCGCPGTSTAVESEAYAAKFRATRGAKYECAKCGHPEFDVGEIRASGGILSSVFEVESEKFAYISCKRCGYTEFYRGERSILRHIFDLGI
jgi:uncharacterized protein